MFKGTPFDLKKEKKLQIDLIQDPSREMIGDEFLNDLGRFFYGFGIKV
jgi:hypothetical protein